MPIYVYRCAKCKRTSEVFHRQTCEGRAWDIPLHCDEPMDRIIVPTNHNMGVHRGKVSAAEVVEQALAERNDPWVAAEKFQTTVDALDHAVASGQRVGSHHYAQATQEFDHAILPDPRPVVHVDLSGRSPPRRDEPA